MRDLYKKLATVENILPCPFCGYGAELWEYEPTEGTFQKVVMCSNDGDEENNIEECPMYMPSNGFYKATKREAILTWNTRPA